jgi:hypothetical protein
MFIGNPARPSFTMIVLQGLRLADAAEWVSHDIFDELHDPECDPGLTVDPEFEIAAKSLAQHHLTRVVG